MEIKEDSSAYDLFLEGDGQAEVKKIKRRRTQTEWYENLLPSVSWIRNVTGQDVLKDIIAGVTVGVLLIPQSMSYAALAYLPPQFGLYTGFIPLIVFAFTTSSYHVSIGPVAPVCVLVGDALIGIVGSDSIDSVTGYGNEKFQEAASGLALVAGIIMLFMALMRLGFVVKYLSIPVMTGFVTGAAFIIFGNQLKGIFRLDCEKTSYFYSTFYNALAAMGTIHWNTTLLSAISLAFLFGCRYFNAPRWFPAPFILMFVTTILSYSCDFENNLGMKIVGDLPSGIPTPSLPRIFSFEQTLIQGFVVALVAYVGSLGLAKSMARDSPIDYEVNANTELVAYGMSSVIGSFFLAFPPAASFSRSALCFEMEAQTPLHGVFTATLMCLALFVTVAFKYLPKCVLAVIIVMSVRRLLLNGWKEVVYLVKTRSTDFFECFLCILAVCFLGITNGIVVGVVLSFINYIHATSFTKIFTEDVEDQRNQSIESNENATEYRSSYSNAGQEMKTTHLAPGGPNRDQQMGPIRKHSRISFSQSLLAKKHGAVVQPQAGVYYANIAKITDEIKSSVKGIEDTLIIDLMYSPFLDSTSARMLLDSMADASTTVGNIIVCNCCAKVSSDLKRYAMSDAHKNVLEFVTIMIDHYVE